MSVYFRIIKVQGDQKEEYGFYQPLDDCVKNFASNLSVVDGKPLEVRTEKLSFKERVNFNTYFGEMMNGNEVLSHYSIKEEENMFLLKMKVTYEIWIKYGRCCIL